MALVEVAPFVPYECEGCGMTVDADNLVCGCAATHCPFCVQSDPWTACEHLVAAFDTSDGFTVTPIVGAVPALPEHLRASWSDDDMREAFGDLSPLLDAYDNGLTEAQEVMTVLLLERIGAPVVQVEWEVSGTRMCSFGSSWYSQCPDLVREQVAEALGRFAKGFNLLTRGGALPE